MATTLRAALAEVFPVADSADNNNMSDVIGNKTDTVSGDSLIALVKYIEQLATSIKDATDHLEDETSQGLNASFDSIAYRVGEIERHLHNSALWFGRDSGDGFLNRASITPWVLVCGSGEAYGTEVQLSDGTEISSGDPNHYFDLHETLVVENNAGSAVTIYKIEFWHGTGTFAAASLLTECVATFFQAADNHGVITMVCPRMSCNHKIWARAKCNINSRDVSILIGGHVYTA